MKKPSKMRAFLVWLSTQNGLTIGGKVNGRLGVVSIIESLSTIKQNSYCDMHQSMPSRQSAARRYGDSAK